MPKQESQKLDEGHKERIKGTLSATRQIAKNLDFDEELDFKMGLPDPQRRTMLKAGGAAAMAGVLAGCPSSPETEQTPEPEPEGTATPTEEPSEDGGDGAETERSETVQMEAHQFEFSPQQIRVPPNTELTIEFTKSTFEEQSGFTLHTFALTDGDYDVGPIELPKNTDDEIIESVTFVTEHEGTFQFECSVYCGNNHAQMNGQLMVVPEGEEAQEIDYTEMETLKDRHRVINEPSSLPQEKQHDLDLRDVMVVTERNIGAVSMIDTVNDEFMERVEEVGKAIHVHDFHPDLPDQSREGAYVYTQSRQGEMFKIDMFGFNRVAVADAGSDARDIAVSQDGEWVIGGFYNPNHLVVCDAETMEPVKRIPTRTVNPDGQNVGSRVCSLYDVPGQSLFLAGLKEGGEVWLIDYSKTEGENNFPVVATIDCGRILHDGFFTDDGRYFMIASQADNQIDVIDCQEQEHAATIPMDTVPHPGPGALYPEQERAFTTHAGAGSVGVWKTNTFEREKLIDTRGSGLFIQKHENSDYVWADVILTGSEDDAYVYQIDPESLEVANEIDCSQWGAAATIHPEFSRDGSKVYISAWQGDTEGIFVFDPNSGEKLGEIGTDTLKKPTGKFLGLRAEGH